MSKKLVYDLPTRLFHWLFATLFVMAFTIGKTVDDDSSFFSYHMLAGIVLCCLVVWRLFWGLLGTKYARFTGFSLNPIDLLSYFKQFVSKSSRTWAGHNPASSWAAVIMMLFALGLGTTGYMMTSGIGGDEVENIHELLANGFLIVALLHIAGVAMHTIRHKDAIWKSMFTGEKSNLEHESQAVSPHKFAGVILVVIAISISGYLLQNFDSRTKNLDIFGIKYRLAEAEEHEHHGDRHKSKSRYQKKHDD